MKEIKCENNAGQSIIFTYDFTPLHLVSVDGIYKVESNIYMTDNTMIDGSTYQGSTIAKRNIVITAEMKDNYQNNRNLLYKVFKPKEKGTMTYTENDESRQIEYVVEDMEITEKGVVRTATISLLCPDPYFKDLDNIEINMTSWIPMFEWDHEFKDEGEEFSVKDTEQIKDIDTESAADYIGVTIIIAADGNVTNPSIYHFETDETIKVLTTLTAGQRLIITTETNDKNIYLEKDGKREEINALLDEDSEFIQLFNGVNTLQYDADSGAQYMNVMVIYKRRYLGV